MSTKSISSIKILMAGVAAMALVAGASLAQAENTTTIQKTVTTGPGVADTTVKTTVTTKVPTLPTTTETTTAKTTWETKEQAVIPSGTKVFNLIEFDANNDHILSRREVGDRIFKFYDTDGNEVIDNIEFERRAVLSVLPITKETVVTYDLDGDGLTDQKEVTNETFLENTALVRFDQNKDGLSPREFMDRGGFLESDINNDKVIDLKEWQASYDASIDARLQAEAQVND